jgi:hypothetical protein
MVPAALRHGRRVLASRGVRGRTSAPTALRSPRSIPGSLSRPRRCSTTTARLIAEIGIERRTLTVSIESLPTTFRRPSSPSRTGGSTATGAWTSAGSRGRVLGRGSRLRSGGGGARSRSSSPGTCSSRASVRSERGPQAEGAPGRARARAGVHEGPDPRSVHEPDQPLRGIWGIHTASRYFFGKDAAGDESGGGGDCSPRWPTTPGLLAVQQSRGGRLHPTEPRPRPHGRERFVDDRGSSGGRKPRSRKAGPRSRRNRPRTSPNGPPDRHEPDSGAGEHGRSPHSTRRSTSTSSARPNGP